MSLFDTSFEEFFNDYVTMDTEYDTVKSMYYRNKKLVLGPSRESYYSFRLLIEIGSDSYNTDFIPEDYELYIDKLRDIFSKSKTVPEFFSNLEERML